MKYYISCILVCLFMCSAGVRVYAQYRPAGLPRQSQLFRNFTGYKNGKEEVQMEGEGYSIDIIAYKLPPNEGNFQTVGNSLHGHHTVILEKLNSNPLENYVLDGSMPKANPPVIAYDYLFGGKNNNIIDIGISRHNKVDEAFIKQIINSLYYDGIYDSILVDRSSKKIDFIGHKLEFVDDCLWLKPHMIQCGKGNTITWSIYNTLAAATEAKQQELAAARALMPARPQDNAKAPIVFEGQDIVADKIIFDKDFAGITLKNGKPAIVYYIATEIKGKAVFCRIAYPREEVKMPFFISRIMRLR